MARARAVHGERRCPSAPGGRAVALGFLAALWALVGPVGARAQTAIGVAVTQGCLQAGCYAAFSEETSRVVGAEVYLHGALYPGPTQPLAEGWVARAGAEVRFFAGLPASAYELTGYAGYLAGPGLGTLRIGGALVLGFGDPSVMVYGLLAAGWWANLSGTADGWGPAEAVESRIGFGLRLRRAPTQALAVELSVAGLSNALEGQGGPFAELRIGWAFDVPRHPWVPPRPPPQPAPPREAPEEAPSEEALPPPPPPPPDVDRAPAQAGTPEAAAGRFPGMHAAGTRVAAPRSRCPFPSNVPSAPAASGRSLACAGEAAGSHRISCSRPSSSPASCPRRRRDNPSPVRWSASASMLARVRPAATPSSPRPSVPSRWNSSAAPS